MLSLCSVPAYANQFVVKKQKIKEKKSTLEQTCLEEIGAIFELTLELQRMIARDVSTMGSEIRLRIIDVQERCVRLLHDYLQDGACALFAGKDKIAVQQLAKQLKAWKDELCAARNMQEPQRLHALHASLDKEKKLLHT